MPDTPIAQTEQRIPVLAHPFRIFFLASAVYAVLVVAAWLIFLSGLWPLPLGWSPIQWHSHEMLYGFVTAAIAGFLLTAITNWTGALPLTGWRLASLVLLWLSGRVSMWLAGTLPLWLVATVNLAFLPILALYVTGVLIRFNNHRNLILIAVLTLLFVGQALMQIGLVTHDMGLTKVGKQVGFDVIILLIVIIAGRITPAFSGNWLRSHGDHQASQVRSYYWLEMVSIVSVLALIVTSLLSGPSWLQGTLALFAGISNGLRLVFWKGWLVVREPMLWILHLAYGWVVVSLLLRGATDLTGFFPQTLWQHTLGLGGIGTLILGVMTRVCVGHTGRPLKLLRFALLSYLLIIIATIVRILTAMGAVNFSAGIRVSGICWVLAFAVFLVLYAPVLTRPRADGKPG